MRVPQSYMQDVATPQNPITGDQYVAPEQLLIAAGNMDRMGRLFDSSGGSKPTRMLGAKGKPGRSLRPRR